MTKRGYFLLTSKISDGPSFTLLTESLLLLFGSFVSDNCDNPLLLLQGLSFLQRILYESTENITREAVTQIQMVIFLSVIVDIFLHRRDHQCCCQQKMYGRDISFNTGVSHQSHQRHSTKCRDDTRQLSSQSNLASLRSTHKIFATSSTYSTDGQLTFYNISFTFCRKLTRSFRSL